MLRSYLLQGKPRDPESRSIQKQRLCPENQNRSLSGPVGKHLRLNKSRRHHLISILSLAGMI